jgi:hypothetical protein
LSWRHPARAVEVPQGRAAESVRVYPEGEWKSKRGSGFPHQFTAPEEQEYRAAAERHAGIAQANRAIHSFGKDSERHRNPMRGVISSATVASAASAAPEVPARVLGQSEGDLRP